MPCASASAAMKHMSASALREWSKGAHRAARLIQGTLVPSYDLGLTLWLHRHGSSVQQVRQELPESPHHTHVCIIGRNTHLADLANWRGRSYPGACGCAAAGAQSSWAARLVLSGELGWRASAREHLCRPCSCPSSIPAALLHAALVGDFITCGNDTSVQNATLEHWYGKFVWHHCQLSMATQQHPVAGQGWARLP